MTSEPEDGPPEPQLPVFDDAFVRGGPREPSADERAARAERERMLATEQAEAARRARSARRPHRRVGRSLRRLAPTIIVVALLVGFAWAQRSGDGGGFAAGGFLIDIDDSSRPTPQTASSDEPLGVPSPAPLSDSFLFMSTQSDDVTPVAYDPCREIHVVINGRTVPTGAERVVHEAIDEISAITGLQFVIEGEVDEVPVAQRETYQPDRYGDRWAPVLVAWSDPEELPELSDVAGFGGSAPVDVDGTSVYVSGIVALNGPSFNRFMASPNGSELARAVVLHELGHLLGLAHVDDAAQLMYHDNVGRTIPQAGDRAGLVQLGQGACVSEL